MGYFKISFTALGQRYQGIKEKDVSLEEISSDYFNTLQIHYRPERITAYECIELTADSEEVKMFLNSRNLPDGANH